MARIIALIGIDGSGKTTQVRLLYHTLKKCGFKVKTIYASNTGVRLGHKFSFYFSLPIDLIIHRLLGIHDRSILFKYPALFKLEEFLLFLNYITLVLPKILFYERTYQVLIADRYVYDYILSRIVIRDKSLTLARTLVRITPRPDVVVLLDVNEDIAYNRKCGEKAMDELKSLRKLYLKLVTKLGGHVINASKSKFEVLNNIWKTIRVEMGDYVSGPKKANTHL